MTPERWRIAEDLFHQAAALRGSEQREWLARTAGGDRELIALVERMLDEDRQNGGTIEAAIGVAASAAYIETGAPDRLGAYRILRQLGGGGMGSVFLAERADDQYHKLVAIKLMRHELASPASRERFLQERQILANLDHPYIAGLIDGGEAPDGRPYLVLDYVEGLPVTEFVSRNGLGQAQVCRLFIKVCEAVAYAHQNLIVHRDLKPGNILVGEDGTPKLLDFGIAKLIGNERGDLTTQAALGLMTPQYASPEQVRGDPITTATDVYALGAILYELIAGQPAFRWESMNAAGLLRTITEETAEKPSRVSKSRVSADLDNIVLKAMEKDPRQRYGTAAQLAEDVQRYLDGRPVVARGRSLTYRARKFVQRHWVPAAAAALMVVTLAGAAFVSRRQAVEAGRARAEAIRQRDLAAASAAEAETMRALAVEQRDRAGRSAAEASVQRQLADQRAGEAARSRAKADERFGQLRQLVHKFLFEIDDAIENLAGATKARQTLVNTALQYLDAMSKETIPDEELRRDLATAYERVGDLQGNPAKPNLGDFKGALASYEKALAIRKTPPLDTGAARRSAMVLHSSMHLVLYRLGRNEEADQLIGKGLELAAGKWMEDPDVSLAAAGLYYVRGQQRSDTARNSLALADFRAVEKIFSAEYERRSRDAKIRNGLHLAQYQIGRNLFSSGQIEESLRYSRLAWEGLEQLAGEMPNNAEYQRNLHLAAKNYGDNLSSRLAGPHRKLEEALIVMQGAFRAAERLQAADPANLQARLDLAMVIAGIGRVRATRNEWEAAAQQFEKSLEMIGLLIQQRPENTVFLFSQGYLSMEAGAALAVLGQHERGIEFLRRGLQSFEAIGAKDQANRWARTNVAQAHRVIADNLLKLNRHDEARQGYLLSVSMLEELVRQDPQNRTIQSYLEQARKALASLPLGQR